MSHEIWMAENQILYKGPHIILDYPSEVKYQWNYCFYDKQTGEVYGSRFQTESKNQWSYWGTDKPFLHFLYEDLRLLPEGVFEYYLNYMLEKLDDRSTSITGE